MVTGVDQIHCGDHFTMYKNVKSLKQNGCIVFFVNYTSINFILKNNMLCSSLEANRRDIPRGSVVKNSPANAGDTGSILDPARSHRGGAAKPMQHNY